MGRSLNLRVVAEGVETEEELEFLQAQHCDEAQGYYFSRPVPSRQFATLLESGLPKVFDRHFVGQQAPEGEPAGVTPAAEYRRGGMTYVTRRLVST